MTPYLTGSGHAVTRNGQKVDRFGHEYWPNRTDNEAAQVYCRDMPIRLKEC